MCSRNKRPSSSQGDRAHHSPSQSQQNAGIGRCQAGAGGGGAAWGASGFTEQVVSPGPLLVPGPPSHRLHCRRMDSEHTGLLHSPGAGWASPDAVLGTHHSPHISRLRTRRPPLSYRVKPESRHLSLRAFENLDLSASSSGSLPGGLTCGILCRSPCPHIRAEV